MLNISKINFTVKYYLPLLLWMGVIFYLSSLPGSGYQGPHTLWFYVERKGAHIFEYFILTLLFARVLKSHGINIPKRYFLAGIFSLLFAFSDEFHQSFIFSREGKILDIVIDLAGIILATTTYYIARLKLRKK